MMLIRYRSLSESIGTDRRVSEGIGVSLVSSDGLRHAPIGKVLALGCGEVGRHHLRGSLFRQKVLALGGEM